MRGSLSPKRSIDEDIAEVWWVWYSQRMSGADRKRSLPAGVVPATDFPSIEDRGSRVRPKAPAVEGSQVAATAPASRPTAVARARELVERLVEMEPHEIAPVVRRLIALGDLALEELAKAFPGPLWRPSLATDTRLPRPEEISAPAAAMAAFDHDCVPYLVRLLKAGSTKTRFYAAIVCGAIRHPDLIAPLTDLALVEDRDCRRVALYLVSSYQREPGYKKALAGLRRHAADEELAPDERRRAISALTQLRDEASAALFVDLLTDADRGTATASRVGLRVLTAHDFGFAREPWLRWLAEVGHSGRIDWLIDGLGDARANIRLLASRELWALTRFLPALSENAARDEFSKAQRSYRAWWTRHAPPTTR